MKTVKDLTTEEKLRFLCGEGYWHTADLGGKLPQVSVSDGPIGLRTTRVEEDGTYTTLPAIAYPSVQVLANTWDGALARKMGECLADDCIERKVDVLLAPGVNIKRSPFNGRNFEYFSEDPYLAGTLAREYIFGLQGKGVAACLKHFVANNLEFDRFHQTSDVDERTLREIYYKPFEIACEAKPVSVMCSYNRVNGVYASENEKGFQVLREEFGFDGAVMSDWESVRDRAKAAKAGLDLEMPFSEKNYQKLIEDFKAGKISEEELDKCASRMLQFVYGCEAKRKEQKIATTEKQRREAGKKIAAEGAVLLKNNGVLPLQKGQSVALCGGCAIRSGNRDALAGGGSSRVNWLDPSFNLVEALQKRHTGKIVYEPAFRFHAVLDYDTRNAVNNAARADVNVVCACTGSAAECEGSDRETLRLPVVQERVIRDTARQNKNTVVVLFAGAAVDTSSWENDVAAILYMGFTGMGGDEVLAKLLTGELNPCGKLTETFMAEENLPDLHVGCGVTRYQEGLDVGYRYYGSHGVPVLYPFGFGLSYSSFEYETLKLKVTGDALDVNWEIKNDSLRDGKEIAQVYVRPCAPLVYRPEKELKGFAKVSVAAGGSAKAGVKLPRAAFAYWSTSKDCWTVDDGVYEILVCASSEDVRLRAKLEIKEGKIIL